MNSIVPDGTTPVAYTYFSATRAGLSTTTLQVALVALTLLALTYRCLRKEIRRNESLEPNPVIERQKNTIDLLIVEQNKLREVLRNKVDELSEARERLKFYRNQMPPSNETSGIASLPFDVVKDILGRLSVKMLCRSSRVNRRFYAAATDVLKIRANEYGYSGTLTTESTIYLRDLFKGLKLLALKGISSRSSWKGNYDDLENFYKKVKGSFHNRCDAFRFQAENLIITYSELGHTHVALAIIRLGIDPRVWERVKNSALQMAAASNAISTVQLLLNEGANPNSFSGTDEPLLFEAIRRGDDKIAQALLDKGAETIGRHAEKGNTALMVAVECNNLTVLNSLLENSAALSTLYEKNHMWESVIHLAASCGHYDALELLLKKGGRALANYNLPLLGTPLRRAAFNGNLDCIELLAEYGADLSLKDLGYGTDPYDPAESDFLPEVDKLLRRLSQSSQAKSALSSTK